MHVCMDEIRLIAPALVGLVGALGYFRAHLRRFYVWLRTPEPSLYEGCGSGCAPPPKVCQCGDCSRSSPEARQAFLEREAAGLREWLRTTAPTFIRRLP